MPIAFLYSGVMPFVAALLCCVYLDLQDKQIHYLVASQIFFATFIIMFMIGSYWGQGIASGDKSSLLIAVGLTIGMLIVSFVTLRFMAFAYVLLLYIPMFWILYAFDRKHLTVHHAFEGYLKHRLVATSVLTLSLCLTALLI